MAQDGTGKRAKMCRVCCLEDVASAVCIPKPERTIQLAVYPWCPAPLTGGIGVLLTSGSTENPLPNRYITIDMDDCAKQELAGMPSLYCTL